MSSLLAIPYQVVIQAADSQIAFDCTVKERHSHKLTVTDHPVEENASVADHARKEPDGLDLQGLISNQPILLNAAEDLQPSVPGTDPKNRAKAAYIEFCRLQDTVALLTVSTEMRVYQNMVIESIAVDRDKTTRNILDIGLSLRPFRTASVETVAAPEPIDPVHKVKRDQGRKQTKPAKPEVETKSTSLLESISNALGQVGG